MNPFIRFATEFNGSQPQFDTAGLDSEQQTFINGCLKVWQGPDFKDKSFNLAMVMWKNEKDFAAMMVEVEDPFLSQLEFEATWENAGMTL